jgi:GR25 family glycosyltransferase involved in LPS biosynthesis
MRSIGITYHSSKPLYSGINATAFVLMEIYQGLGCHVIMADIANEGNSEWKSAFHAVQWSNAYQTRDLDLLIDVDGTLASKDRAKMATRSVVFLRSFLQFTELEMSTYMESPYVPRDLEGVAEIWCWDQMNPVETLASVELLFPCPIRRMPYSWTSAVIRYLDDRRDLRHSSTYTKDLAWTIHVAERNKNNQSTSVLPMVAVRELHLKRAIDAQYLIHDMDHLKDNRFLKENVLINIESDKLPLQMVGPANYLKWLEMPNQLLLSHVRFQPIRFAVLNAIWLGIPVVHNSPVLRDAHPLLQSLYYTGNSIQEMAQVIRTFSSSPETWYASLSTLRLWMEHAYSWKRENAIGSWKDTLALVADADKKSVTFAEPLQEVKIIEAPSTEVTAEIVVAFSDMWPGFHSDRNYLLDALRHEYPSRSIQGVSYDPAMASTYRLLLFGPFGQTWKSAPASLPRVYFSAENWEHPDDPSIACYLTPSRQEDDRHLRVATWATFIDWFSGSTELPGDSMDNPIRLPLHFAMNPHPVEWKSRREFCAFVVSNPVCEFRNRSFEAVHAYKKVNSGGGLYNNIGGQLSLKYPGGGCGDLSKHHFFVAHQYTLSFENSQAPGYVTEKLLHAKMAGCVPLYWGDAEAHRDFVPESFINVSAVKDPAMIVHLIKKLEANPDMCAKMAATPLLNEEKKQAALKAMSAVSRKLMSLMESATASPVPDTPMEGIVSTYVINLDHRADRWNTLLEVEPWIKTHGERASAVYGKAIQMTPIIYDLFEHNNYNWKKSVIGCALSHIKLWSKIAASEVLQPNDKVLILEDDVRFSPAWREQWAKAVQCIPEDADLLYLGGVLPPNKPALAHVLQPVNDCWATIRPNKLFSHVELPLFHFCAYSYILTPLGAQKLVVGLMESREKAAIAIDHVLGHPMYGLRTYVIQPLMTHCFQENDPIYVNSDFNKIERQDSFDSDIWNNTEFFTEEELAPFRTAVSTTVPSSDTMEVYYRADPEKPFDLYERKWLECVFGRTLECKPYVMGENPPADNAWFIVQRPYSEEWSKLFYLWNEKGVSFRVLHLSDEFTSDDITFYTLPRCKAVVRNYIRADVPRMGHIVTIPLGYHHSSKEPPKAWKDRSLLWSFHGTDWFQRGEQLSKFSHLVPNSCRLLPSWNHSTMTSEQDYLRLLNESKFCPILKGNHNETFRLYETLEAGALPVTTITDPRYLSWVEENLGLEKWYSWNKALDVLSNESAVDESIRLAVQTKWAEWKARIQAQCQALL